MANKAAPVIEDNYSIPWELLGIGSLRADEEMNVTDPWYRLRMDRTLSQISYSLGETIKVLDLGCGTGLYDFTIARRWPRAHITGIDINQQQIDFAKRTAHKLGMADKLEFLCSDITSFTSRDDYNLVLLTDIVEHFEFPNNCLATAWAALSDHGNVIVSVPFTSQPRDEWWFYRQLLPDGSFRMANTPEKLNPTQPILKYWHKEYSVQELVDLLGTCGFRVTASTVCRFDYRYLRKQFVRPLRHILDLFSDNRRAFKPRFDKIACAIMPSWARTCIVVATKE